MPASNSPTTSDRSSPSIELLRGLYSSVKPLHEALGIPLASVRAHHGDRALLKNAVVCYHAKQCPIEAVGKQRKAVESSLTMAQVLRALLDGDRVNESHALALGHGKRHRTNSVLEDVRRSPEWAALLKRIGGDAMLRLLSETSIFLPHGDNSCYIQYIGETLNEVVRRSKSAGLKRTSKSADDRPAKRRKTESKTLGPTQIELNRTRLFFASARFDRAHRLKTGFVPEHPLSFLSENKTETLDARGRALLARIFPRDHGLVHVFTPVDPNIKPWERPPDCARDARHREQEIHDLLQAGKPIVGSSRLAGGPLQIAKLLLERHAQCDYKALLDRAVPSRLVKKTMTTEEATQLLAYISEDPVRATQRLDGTLASRGPPPTIVRPTQRKREAPADDPLKPRFDDLTCSHQSVARFLALVIDEALPSQLFGSPHNQKVFTDFAAAFVRGGRHDTFTLHAALQGWRITDCALLAPTSGKSGHQRVSASDATKRQELLQEMLFWLVEGFVVPLLQSAFYITDSSVYRSRTLYFRQDDWAVITRPLLDNFASTTFGEIDGPMMDQPVGRVRLMPKLVGVRPIVNLRKISRTVRCAVSLLQLTSQPDLKNVKAILDVESTGAALPSVDKLHDRLLAFKQSLAADGRPLYFVKVDVRACFDTIKQERLLDLVLDLLEDGQWSTERYVKISRQTSGAPVTRYVQDARKATDPPFLVELATRIADRCRNSLLVDLAVQREFDKYRCMRIINTVFNDHVVALGGKHYVQREGIPQGSILSILLCNLYYAAFEAEQLAFLDDAPHMLARLVDDFLLITTDEAHARRFVKLMHDGIESYGCSTALEKSVVNFDVAADEAGLRPRIVDAGQGFPWAGALIDQTTLAVRIDFGYLGRFDVADGLRIKHGRSEGQAFLSAMLQYASIRARPIYSDIALNDLQGALLNFYQSMVYLSMRFCAHARVWKADVSSHVEFFLDVIDRTVLAAQSLWARSSPPRNLPPAAYRRKLIWLGYVAFRDTLRRKPSRFTALIPRITWTDARVRIPTLDETVGDLGDEPTDGILQAVVSSPLQSDLLKIVF